MKKVLLVLALLLVFSTVAMADSFYRTAVESVNRKNEDGWEYNYINWINADLLFKPSEWGNFQLGYKSWKTHVEDGDHGGEVGFEFKPGYDKATDWGNYGGQLIIAQGHFDNAIGGWDAIKPEVWMTYNLNNRSRISARALYSLEDRSCEDHTDHWYETEIQYRYDIGGGNLGTGIFIGEGVEKSDNDEIRGLLNYNKYFPKTKIFTNLYSELRFFENPNKDWKAYKVGVYANRPLWHGFVLEAEANVFQEFDESVNPLEYREVFFMTGIRYNF